MLIREVTQSDIQQWLELAAEVEPVFQGSMVGNSEFYYYLESKITKREAFAAVNRNDVNLLMGIIGFSRTHNRISWFAVSDKYRNKGLGTKLLTCALNQLDRAKEITVTTFRDGYEPGKPARHIYLKLGFVDFDNNLFDDQGNPRCVMKLFPE